MRNAIVVIAMLFAAGAPRAARAYDAPVEVGAFAGGHYFSDTTRLGFIASNPHTISSSGLLGFRFGFVLVPRLELETELGLVPTQVESTGDSVLAFGWRAHALVHILTGRWRPFVVAGGGGFTSSTSNPANISTDTRGELHAGVGLKFDVRCNWGLRLDGRVQFEQATHANSIYFTEDWDIALGVYGLFGRTINEKCQKH
jgi:hypothetical protein